MSINHAILGMLSCKPLTGYDLKKIMQDSPFMYWSGNNNQIYKALVELHNEGYVTNETQHQDGSPSKKIYTITDDGLAELRRWSLMVPEVPEVRKNFLIQFAWTWQLNNSELKNLLDQYEQEVKSRLSIVLNKKNSGYFAPSRTPRESAVWDLINENVVGTFEQELDWIDKTRNAMSLFDSEDYSVISSIAQKHETDVMKMDYKIIDKYNQRYILLDAIGAEVRTEQDGLDLVRICVENETNLLLIQNERFPDDFFRLDTGAANAVLSRLTAYSIKTAAVIPDNRQKGKFRNFVSESNKGRMFHVYPTMTEAENWLLGISEGACEKGV